MPTHPLDWLLSWTRWRRFTAYSLCIVAFGALMMGFAMMDLEMLKAAFAGHRYTEEWSALQARMRPGLRIIAGGGAAAVTSLVMWAVSWYVELEGGPYWFRRSRKARRALVEQGVADPDARQVAAKVLSLEEAQRGWRPETVLRFLEVWLADEDAPVDKAWLDELHAWSVKLRVAADEAFREMDAVHQLEWSGVVYDADTLATLSEKIDAALLDLRFRDKRP